MVHIDIPFRGLIELRHAVFDVNGTLALDGKPFPGVGERLKLLANVLTLHVLTAGTHGNLPEMEQMLGIPFHVINTGDEKTCYVEQLGAAHVIAFGNGVNDKGMLRVAAIGVAVLGGEGVAISSLQVADLLVSSPVDAIDLVLNPKRLVATLRG